MNTKRLTLLTSLGVVLALALLLLRPAASQSDFVIENADARRDAAVALDAGLPTVLAGVTTRFILQYVNVRRDLVVAAAPAPLQAALNQVGPRFVLQYVNVRRNLDMAAPEGMSALLQAVGERFVIQYANARRDLVMGYPRELLNDTTPPQIGSLDVAAASQGVRLRWTSSEFTKSTVEYGLQPGVYRDMVSENYFEKVHDITLPAPPPGSALYFRIVSTDLSGNQSVSAEQLAQAQSFIYLPLVRKR